MVHALDHLHVGFLAATLVVQQLLDALALLLVVGAEPGIVRRIEVEAQKERLLRLGEAIDGLHRAIAEQVRHIAMAVDRHLVLVKWRTRLGAVIEVMRGAAEKAEELVVSCLVGAEARQEAEMPFADQLGRIVGLLEDRRNGRMVWRQANVLRRIRADRLLEADDEPLLIAPGHECGARGRAARRVRISLRKAHALRREPIDVRRRVVALAVAARIGVAEVIGHDE